MSFASARRNPILLRETVVCRWFALGHFLLVIAYGVTLYAIPDSSMWLFLVPLAAWTIRLAFDNSITKRTAYRDWLLASFLISAAVGYWAAYDQAAAWDKFRLIIAAILFYSAISTQPKANLAFLALFWFVVGIGVAGYFILTYDFEHSPEKIHFINQLGLMWMGIRPMLEAPEIHPNDAAGISIITSIYGLYFWELSLKERKLLQAAAVLIGLGTVFMAVLLAASRGAFLALIASFSVWLLWRIIHSLPLSLKERALRIFPCVIVAFVVLAAAILVRHSQVLRGQISVSENVVMSRMELLQSGISIFKDFAFTGGGLDSFPGLYSQYILVIPYYSILNSHNMFLDVMIEQGLIGGFCFLILFLAGIWEMLSALTRADSRGMVIWYWLVFLSLFVAILHGMVDDYIYGGNGTILAFSPIGMAALVAEFGREKQQSSFQRAQIDKAPNPLMISNLRRLLKLGIPSAVGIILLCSGLMWKQLAAQWIANIASVKMAKIELENYPANRWNEGKHIDELHSAEVSFGRALTFDPQNRLANHRLGLIKMLRKDFKSASIYLAVAYDRDASNRGLIKNLGYCYVWLGDFQKASLFLGRIPEASDELGVYIWWWGVQERYDLSEKAKIMLSTFEPMSNQP